MGWLAVFGMGLVLGALGGGGGILTVPILVGLFGMGATEATGASLLVVGLISSVGAIQGFVKKMTDVQAGLLLAIPSTLGALTARVLLVPNIPATFLGITKDKLLLGTFAVIMIIVGIKMLRPATEAPQVEAGRLKIALFGLMIGLVSGVLGAGGGFLILPVLILLVGVELKKAIPTSLMVISLQSLGGFAGELGKPIRWQTLGIIVLVAMVGLVVGLMFRESVPKKALQFSFAGLVFVVAGWMLFRVLS